jgi:hypothetical protein
MMKDAAAASSTAKRLLGTRKGGELNDGWSERVTVSTRLGHVFQPDQEDVKGNKEGIWLLGFMEARHDNGASKMELKQAVRRYPVSHARYVSRDRNQKVVFRESLL